MPTKIRILVTEYDVERSENDPSVNPIARAISRVLKASLNDVEVSRDSVYIWNEWDDPEQIYQLGEEAVRYLTDWEDHNDCPETLEFNIVQRK